MFVSNGILFNHESPRRGEVFVTRKITRTVANIIAGKEKYLYLGNPSRQNGIGDSVRSIMATWLMLQQDRPDNYVIGTGESHSVRNS